MSSKKAEYAASTPAPAVGPPPAPTPGPDTSCPTAAGRRGFDASSRRTRSADGTNAVSSLLVSARAYCRTVVLPVSVGTTAGRGAGAADSNGYSAAAGRGGGGGAKGRSAGWAVVWGIGMGRLPK